MKEAKMRIFLFLLALLLPGVAGAQNIFGTPNNQVAPGAVSMCMNSASKAVPCSSIPAGGAVAAVSSAALETGKVLKSSAGTLYSLSVTSTTVAGYLMLFDAAAVPAAGAVAPIYCMQLAAGATVGVAWPTPLTLATGVSAAFSTTGCTTKTDSATAWFSGQVQ